MGHGKGSEGQGNASEDHGEVSEEQGNVNKEPRPKRRRVLSKQPTMDTDTVTPEEDWFHASQHRDELLEFVRTSAPERDLHMVDLFSASGVAAATFKETGYESKAIDIKLDQGHDITSRAGFFTIFMACLSIKARGLLLAGPPCNLYIFLYHKRSLANNFLGDTSNAKVRLSNLIVANMSLILGACIPRGVKILLEQPMNSVMYQHPSIVALTREQQGEAPVWSSISTCMGHFNHDMPKPTKLLSNMKSAVLVTRTMNLKKWKKERSELHPSGQPPARYTRMTPAGPAGGKDLHRSATYTNEFCMHVLIIWEKEYLREALNSPA